MRSDMRQCEGWGQMYYSRAWRCPYCRLPNEPYQRGTCLGCLLFCIGFLVITWILAELPRWLTGSPQP